MSEGRDAGFLTRFLDGADVPLPSATNRALQDAYDHGRSLHYTHFSILMNARRRVAAFAAHNIDGGRLVRLSRSGVRWVNDERLPGALQVGSEFYSGSRIWTRGHLVRRRDVVWGERGEASRANRQTFTYTNAAPQHVNFNGDEWLSLEDWVLDRAASDDMRLSVFTGPVLRNDDPAEAGVQIPAGFWKLVVRRSSHVSTGVSAYAFLMKQNEMWEDAYGADFLQLAVHQIYVSVIEQVTELDFGPLVRESDALRHWEPLLWRSVVDQQDHREWPRIRGPEDIVESTAGETRSLPGVRSDGPVYGPFAPSRLPGEPTVRVLARPLETASATDREAGVVRTELLRAPGTRQILALGARARASSLSPRWRILGGLPASNHSFPFVVTIGGEKDGRFAWLASGVLLSRRWVLTAAHCARQGYRLSRILAGADEVLAPDEPDLDGAVPVDLVVPHPEYDSNRLPPRDLCLLHLGADTTRGAAIEIAAGVVVRPGDYVDLVGYGRNDPSGRFGFGILRRTQEQVMAWGDHRPADDTGWRFDRDSEFVVGGVGFASDTCVGDSGGPVVVPSSIGPRLLGITLRALRRANHRCGDGGIYARLDHAPTRQWIEDTMRIGKE